MRGRLFRQIPTLFSIAFLLRFLLFASQAILGPISRIPVPKIRQRHTILVTPMMPIIFVIFGLASIITVPILYRFGLISLFRALFQARPRTGLVLVVIHLEGSGIDGTGAGTQIVAAGHPKNVVHGVLGPPASGLIGPGRVFAGVALVEEVALQGVVEGHGAFAEGGGVGLLGHVNAAVAGRVLANLLYGPGAFGSFADPACLPLVATHVHDVLDHEADANGHILIIGRLMEPIKDN